MKSAELKTVADLRHVDALRVMAAHPSARLYRVAVAVARAAEFRLMLGQADAPGADWPSDNPTADELAAWLEHVRAWAEGEHLGVLASLAGARASELSQAIEQRERTTWN